MVKVILLQDIPRVGQKYEVKEVAAGYATNFLYPRRLAEMATTGKVAALSKKKDEADAARRRHAADIEKAVTELNGQKVSLSAKADEKDHLFKKLRADDIVKALPKHSAETIPVGAVHLPEPIKTLGEHEVELSFENARATITLVVEKE